MGADYGQIAVRVRDHLLSQRTEVDGRPSWIGDELQGATVETAVVVRRRVDADLYGGLGGISWFLAHASMAGDCAECVDVARAAATTAIATGHQWVESDALSLHSGATGVALAAADVAARLRDGGLERSTRALANRIVDRLRRGGGRAAESDLLGGLAGTIVGLLTLASVTRTKGAVAAARSLGNELVSRAERNYRGVCWRDAHAPDQQPLCGLAHGASGPIWALAELVHVTKARGFVEALAGALKYERSWFSAERCAWPDLRGHTIDATSRVTPVTEMTAWCHGAIGIGAVRLRLYELTGDTGALAEASAAIEAARLYVMSVGSQRDVEGQWRSADVTLCHGLAGAAELFLLAHEILQRPEHLRAARRVGDLMAGFALRDHTVWPWGARGAEFVPGLFLGLAGIGTTFLRLFEPSSVGSPLLAGRLPPSSLARDAIQ